MEFGRWGQLCVLVDHAHLGSSLPPRDLLQQHNREPEDQSLHKGQQPHQSEDAAVHVWFFQFLILSLSLTPSLTLSLTLPLPPL